MAVLLLGLIFMAMSVYDEEHGAKWGYHLIESAILALLMLIAIWAGNR